MMWKLSHRADPRAVVLADRHYSRQKPGTPQFVPPGRCLVFLSTCERALWVTSWPFAQYTKHAWAGAWICSLFRNEGAGRAQDMEREAVAATRAIWGEPPALGMISFINRDCVRPTMVRGVPVYGWTWLQVGFEPDGETKGGLLCLRLRPERMPPAELPWGSQHDLLAG
jgi:hypothetical protein